MNGRVIHGAALALSLVLGAGPAGCGGREARPVAVTNLGDVGLDCAAVQREFEANERQIVATIREKDSANAKNAILGVTGVVLFWPALFFMDPKSPEKVEIDALRNRNGVLEDIARTKRCPKPQTEIAELYRRLDDLPEKPVN
jgi:hypothetical protein